LLLSDKNDLKSIIYEIDNLFIEKAQTFLIIYRFKLLPILEELYLSKITIG
tara:strand:+ start:125 stop:277 length:153 start_codon:yes stop_codon:yes gene_type:complete